MDQQLEGQLVCFGYEHRFRLVLIDKVWESKAGDRLLTGLDEDRNDIRTFRVDRIIRGKVRVVGNTTAGEALGIPPRHGAPQPPRA